MQRKTVDLKSRTRRNDECRRELSHGFASSIQSRDRQTEELKGISDSEIDLSRGDANRVDRRSPFPHNGHFS
jgi:hypothetical protein